MNRPTITFLAACALLAVGCGGPAKKDSASSSGAPPSGTASPDAPQPGENPLVGLEPDIPEIPPKSTEGWKPPAAEAKLGAVDVAAKMDDSLRSLRNVTCTATIVGETARGRIMPSTFSTSIRDAKTFEVAFMRLEGGVPGTGLAKADGRRVTVLEADGYTDPRPVGAGAQRDAEALVAAWPLTFPADVFDGLVDGGDLFKTLVDGWSKGMHGYRVEIEERSMPYGGRQVKNYRLLAERPVSPGKVETVEIVVDGTLFLPVTIRSKAWDAKGKPTSFQWSAEWKNNQKLDDKKFVVGAG